MSYRPHLETRVLRQMQGLPDDAFDTLVRILARVCADPYDRLLSVPVTKDGRERMAELERFRIHHVHGGRGSWPGPRPRPRVDGLSRTRPPYHGLPALTGT